MNLIIWSSGYLIISSSGHFVVWSFRRLVISSSGRFDVWPFRCLVVSMSGHLVPGIGSGRTQRLRENGAQFDGFVCVICDRRLPTARLAFDTDTEHYLGICVECEPEVAEANDMPPAWVGREVA